MLRCKLYRRGERVSLSDVLPMFESLGLTVTDERPYEVTPRDGAPAWIYDFGLQARGRRSTPTRSASASTTGFARVWHGEAEQDGFNGLIIGAGLDWREVTMLRAVARYLRQAGIPFSDRYMEQTLLAHPGVAASLVRAVPRALRSRRATRGGADAVAARSRRRSTPSTSLDEDRILRGFLSVVQAMLRTNYYLPGPKPYVSFKLDPTQIPLVPLPRPRFEIFVHSPRVEGVHLRGGSVARGGLRWSRPARGLPHRDPRPDEGADGQERADRAGGREGRVRGQARRATRSSPDYTTFISGAAGHHRHDLAAARSCRPRTSCATTATTRTWWSRPTRARRRSRTSPTGSREDYGFWLGDAFASGGSVGYDHKAMGITARSAWVSVQRHFRELGVDVQAEDFTVAGIGDMSGDVFGNGMLLSRAHPARGRVRPPPHLPRPDARRGGRRTPSGGGCSSCRARRGRTTTRR